MKKFEIKFLDLTMKEITAQTISLREARGWAIFRNNESLIIEMIPATAIQWIKPLPTSDAAAEDPK